MLAHLGQLAAKQSWEDRTHRLGSCSVTLVKQHSNAACIAGKSFGCDSNGDVWARGCRGHFRCGAQDEDARFACGFPPGRPAYTCKCVRRMARRPRTPHREGLCSVTLVKQHSQAACVPGITFGCAGDDPSGRRVWVRNCRGIFRCTGDSAFHCGYPISRLPNQQYNCSCDPREQIMPGCTTPVCLRLRMKMNIDADLLASSSLVVIGAHHFGRDSNDPVYAAVATVAWSRVLLVEASPIVSAALRAQVVQANPTPHVPPDQVSVVNAGICPLGAKDLDAAGSNTPRPFFSLPAMAGLPHWVSQIGSFNVEHIESHLVPLVSWQSAGSKLDVSTLRRSIRATNVSCGSLLRLLRLQSMPPIGLLVVDTEGLDCEILGSQDWSSKEWCKIGPTVLVFEWKHCVPSAHTTHKGSAGT